MCPVSPREPPAPYPPGAWWPITPDRTEVNRAALSHQHGLESTLSALLSHIKSGQPNSAALEKGILVAQKHAASLSEFLTGCIPQTLYNEQRSDSSTAAQRAFAIAELLEMILGFLEIPDILQMRQVSHSMKDSIESSTKLQAELSLRAAPSDAHIYSPFERCLNRDGGFSCTINNFYYHPHEVTNSYDVRAYFFPLEGQRLPKIGPAYRRMFICQPPITEMKVYLSCCPEDQPWGYPPAAEICSVSSADGLTIGHLYDCAIKLMEEHRNCPFASTYSMDDDGMVKTGVQFKGSVVPPMDHPFRKAHVKCVEARKKENLQYDVRRAKLTAYRTAKIQAHNDGDSIPTFKEFEAANAGTDWAASVDTLGLPFYSSQPFSSFIPPPPPLAQIAPPPPPPPPPPQSSGFETFDALDNFDFDSILNQG